MNSQGNKEPLSQKSCMQLQSAGNEKLSWMFQALLHHLQKASGGHAVDDNVVHIDHQIGHAADCNLVICNHNRLLADTPIPTIRHSWFVIRELNI